MHSATRLAAPLVLLALLSASPARAGGTLPSISDNSGAYAYQVPLPVPAGPAGSTPDLLLHYSSASPNGNAGVGWSLPYSSIRVDSSWGVPGHWLKDLDLCDPDVAAGRLWLDGMELVPNGDDPLAPGQCTYRTRPDTFALVVPIWDTNPSCGVPPWEQAPDGEPVGFAVVRQDGDVWWYGSPDACDEVGRVTVGQGDQKHTGRWLLRAVQDRDGNQVTFWPDRIPHGTDAASVLVDTVYQGEADLRGCDGCLRAITWAERLHREGHAAFDPTPILDGGAVVGFSASAPYLPRGLSGEFSAFLHDPGSYFPAEATNHFYAAQVDWESRPDARVQYSDGSGRRIDRRIKQIAVGADVVVSRDLNGEVRIDSASTTWVRSHRLDYTQSSTGRSLLSRVVPIAGAYEPSAAYPGRPPRDAPWDALGTPEDIDNPWEFVWQTNDVLDASASLLGGEAFGSSLDMEVLPGNSVGAPLPWLGAHWEDGGFPTVLLADMNGDSLPDLVQHDAELPVFPQNFNNFLVRIAPYGDWLPNPGGAKENFVDLDEASPSFWVRYNNGHDFMPIEEGPVDPFALQAVADFIPWDDCDDDGIDDPPDDCADQTRANLVAVLDESDTFFETQLGQQPDATDCDGDGEPDSAAWCLEFQSSLLGSDLDDILSVGDVCELWWTGLPSMLGMMGIAPETIGVGRRQAAWCEHRSCAPYCEAGSNANAGPYAGSHGGADSIVDPGVSGLELEDVVGLETTKKQRTAGSKNGGDLVLWRKYAVTRGKTGTTLGNVSRFMDWIEAPFVVDPVLLALESNTRVRWVDGYARPSFQTRLYSEDVEIARGVGVVLDVPPQIVEVSQQETYSDAAPDRVEVLGPGSTVLEALIHDTMDINGDGYLDRVLGGGAVLESTIPGWQMGAVFNPDESAPKDLVVSTQHMPWFVSLFDPGEGEFGEILPWDFPIGDQLLGADQPGGPAFADGDRLDPRMWEPHHLNMLGVWESTDDRSRTPVSAGVSYSASPSGPSVGVSASLGPVSLSMGRTAKGGSVGIGVGPVSFSTSGLSIGPVTMDDPPLISRTT